MKDNENGLETKQRGPNLRIEEDLFLVKFGDKKDKQKVLDVSMGLR